MNRELSYVLESLIWLQNIDYKIKKRKKNYKEQFGGYYDKWQGKEQQGHMALVMEKVEFI